jgi:hypothetical protein
MIGSIIARDVRHLRQVSSRSRNKTSAPAFLHTYRPCRPGPKAREKREKVNSFNAIEEFSDFHMKI